MTSTDNQEEPNFFFFFGPKAEVSQPSIECLEMNILFRSLTFV